jgi:SWI/SNF-related matrix-associated actin-dependent regulator of chromatin subfamily A containing DEAD/H box 1
VFYANGTLTKYEVVDLAALHKVTMSAAASTTPTPVIQPATTSNATTTSASSSSANGVTTIAGLRVQATRLVGASTLTTSRFFSKLNSTSTSPSALASSLSRLAAGPAAAKRPERHPSPQDVSDADVALTTNRKRNQVEILDDDFSDAEEVEETKDEEASTPVKPRRAKKARVIVESDDDEDDDGDEGDGNKTGDEVVVNSDVSSPADEEDDVFMHELKLKQERSGVTPKWMEAFGLGGKSTSSTRGSADGWYSARDRKNSTQSNLPSRKKEKSRRTISSYDDDEDDVEASHTARSHDEVGQLLRDCASIAEKLRRSIKSWSGKSAATAGSSPSKIEDETHISLSQINSDSNAVGSRIVTQADIPDICETLELKPYQTVGLNWLLLLCDNGVSGVLADEMGLGKTVQTIAFLLLMHALAKTKDATKYGGPHIVVVPASVLNNWKREFAWIAPTLRIVVYHGSKDVRMDMQESLTVDDFDVILTTYTYFERDTCQDDRNFLRAFKFGYMILDEGHSIKNSKTSRFRRISAMRTRNRLVLSGTPIQNNLNELLALLSFLMPKMFDHGSDELLSFFDGAEDTKTAKVRKILAPFVLRREKKYVLTQLVAKKVVVEMIKCQDDQRKVYTDIVESVIKQKQASVARKAEDKERKKKSTKLGRQVQKLLGEVDVVDRQGGETTSDVAIFTQLRKAANHPVLLRNHYVSDEVLDTMTRCLHRAEAFGNQCSLAMVRKELESYSDFELHDLCVQYGGNEELRKLQLPMDTILRSAKFDVLRELLPKLKAEGHRVLIFSQWTKLLDLLEVLMSHMDYRYLRLDGSTEVAERQGLIDSFNQDKNLFVFLLSTRAGGLGINLTAADTVILHDLDFNPTNDEQACDRCHRIGQTKPVTIYKLVAENTVDHDIFKLGESKTQLNNAVLGKLNAHGQGQAKSSENVTVEMLLASVLSSYKKE